MIKGLVVCHSFCISLSTKSRCTLIARQKILYRKENPPKVRFSAELFARISYMYSPAASRPRICEAPGGAGYRPRRCSVSALFTAVAATLETVRIYSKSVSDLPNLYLTYQFVCDSPNLYLTTLSVKFCEKGCVGSVSKSRNKIRLIEDTRIKKKIQIAGPSIQICLH
jgi:hypothetical protein